MLTQRWESIEALICSGFRRYYLCKEQDMVLREAIDLTYDTKETKAKN